MSKYWYVEDGQVCLRTPYADLRGCDNTMLVACLNERDEKIADLKKQLEEKEKRIRNLNLEAQRYYEDAYCNDFQKKAKIDLAIEQLKKMEYDLLDISNGWWLCFRDGTQYMTHRELEGCLKEIITKQKGEIENE